MSSGTFIIVLKLSRCVGGCYGALKNLTNKPTLQMTYVYLKYACSPKHDYSRSLSYAGILLVRVGGFSGCDGKHEP